MYKVRHESLEHASVLDIGNIGLPAGFLHETAHLGIMYVADARKQVMLDLKIQTSQ